MNMYELVILCLIVYCILGSVDILRFIVKDIRTHYTMKSFRAKLINDKKEKRL